MTATRPLHQRVEARIEQAKMLDTIEGYGRFLAAMHRFHHCAELALAACARAGLGGAVPADGRAALLAGDLAALGRGQAPLQPVPALTDRGAAHGLRYVVEGSALGATQLLPRARALGAGAGHGADFLTRHAGDSRDWAGFVDELEAAGLDADEERSLVAMALAGFTLVEACIDSQICTVEGR